MCLTRMLLWGLGSGESKTKNITEQRVVEMKRRIAFLSAALLLAVSLTGCDGEARHYFGAVVENIPDVGITVNGKQLPVPSGDQIRGFLYTWSDWVEGEVDPYLNREDMKFIPEVASDLALLALKPGHVTDLKVTRITWRSPFRKTARPGRTSPCGTWARAR